MLIAFRPAPRRSASLGVDGGGREPGRRDSTSRLDRLHPRCGDRSLEIHTDGGAVLSDSPALDLVKERLLV